MASSDHTIEIRIGYLILAIGVVLGLYGAYHASRKAGHVSTCVTEWANATAERSAELTALSTTRSNRLDDLIRDISVRSPAKFRIDLRRYIAASNAYKRAVKMNPLPPAPRLRC